MSDLSLQNIMNEMAKGDLTISSPAPSDDFIAQCQNPLSELDALVSQDELLAHLQKEFLNAKASYDRLLRENGADDAMTEVAADMVDSAWCAMQTRMMEVRANGAVMARAQSMMQASKNKIQKNIEDKKKKRALELFHKMQMLQYINKARIQKENRKDKIHFLEMVFVLMMSKWSPVPKTPQYNFSGQVA